MILSILLLVVLLMLLGHLHPRWDARDPIGVLISVLIIVAIVVVVLDLVAGLHFMSRICTW